MVEIGARTERRVESRLEGKVAVIFGAGGEVGAAVAQEFAAQGARLFLSGRTGSRVRAVADAISTDGRIAAVELDALDQEAVDRHVDEVVDTAGRLDIVFNAMGPQPTEYGNGTSTMDLTVERFMVPIDTIVPSLFITARSAARHMGRERSGVLIFLSGTPSRGVAPNTSAIGATFGAVEAMTRSLAVELGPQGVRVVCVRSMGMPETRTMQQTYDTAGRALGVPKEKMAEVIASRALLRRAPSLVDTAKLMSFLASDEARSITGAIINASSGQVLD
ncbi:MAG: SDR family NAD(P)-dependent oxidoreductase [Longimicrobiales bacterium]